MYIPLCNLHPTMFTSHTFLKCPFVEDFLIRSLFFVSKGNLFDVEFCYTAAWCWCNVAAGRTSPRTSTLVQIIFHFPSDHWPYFSIFENGVLLIYTLEGRKQYYKLHYCLWRVSKNRDSHFLIRSAFFVSKGTLFYI